MHSRNDKRIRANVNNCLDPVFKYFACLYTNFGHEIPFFKMFPTLAEPLIVSWPGIRKELI